MSKQVFSQKNELATYLKKGLLLAPFLLLVACGSPIDRQSSNKVSQINKTLADAESGDPNAQFLMGTYYFNGESYLGKQLIPQNKEKASEFFNKSASSGNKAVQNSVNRFLAIEALSAQLAISKSMAQNFYDAYGVSSTKDYESAVSEIKSLGYPVKDVTSITPTEVIFYLDFKKDAIQKNIPLAKAVQDLKKDQNAKVAQQLAKEAEAKQQAEIARQQEIKARDKQARQRETKESAQNITMAEWLRSTDIEIKKNPKYAQAVNENFNSNIYGMCSSVGLAVTVSYAKGQKFAQETLFMAAWLIKLGELYQKQLTMKGTPDAVFEASLQAWRHVAFLQSEFNKAAYQCSEILSKIITAAK